MIYTIKSEVILDKKKECYKKILTINKKSPDLHAIIKTIKRDKVSPFKISCCNVGDKCIHALIHPETKLLLKSDEIDVLFQYITQHNYSIEYNMSKIIQKTNLNKDLICFIKKIDL